MRQTAGKTLWCLRYQPREPVRTFFPPQTPLSHHHSPKPWHQPEQQLWASASLLVPAPFWHHSLEPADLQHGPMASGFTCTSGLRLSLSRSLLGNFGFSLFLLLDFGLVPPPLPPTHSCLHSFFNKNSQKTAQYEDETSGSHVCSHLF